MVEQVDETMRTVFTLNRTDTDVSLGSGNEDSRGLLTKGDISLNAEHTEGETGIISEVSDTDGSLAPGDTDAHHTSHVETRTEVVESALEEIDVISHNFPLVNENDIATAQLAVIKPVEDSERNTPSLEMEHVTEAENGGPDTSHNSLLVCSEDTQVEGHDTATNERNPESQAAHSGSPASEQTPNPRVVESEQFEETSTATIENGATTTPAATNDGRPATAPTHPTTNSDNNRPQTSPANTAQTATHTPAHRRPKTSSASASDSSRQKGTVVRGKHPETVTRPTTAATQLSKCSTTRDTSRPTTAATALSKSSTTRGTATTVLSNSMQVGGPVRSHKMAHELKPGLPAFGRDMFSNTTRIEDESSRRRMFKKVAKQFDDCENVAFDLRKSRIVVSTDSKQFADDLLFVLGGKVTSDFSYSDAYKWEIYSSAAVQAISSLPIKKRRQDVISFCTAVTMQRHKSVDRKPVARTLSSESSMTLDLFNRRTVSRSPSRERLTLLSKPVTVTPKVPLS